SNTSVLQKKSSYEADAAAQDIAGIVAALNQTLSDFSRDIANALHDL
ncbi:MAG: hypothetical protein GY729_16970, partial [Desulfobacteraceae bacterium]|nr:hypothetical protein [Desulfobacteraceae bacterium]